MKQNSPIRVGYNRFTYRWEVWQSGRALPECTHPSRDEAIVIALNMLIPLQGGQIAIYTEAGNLQSILHIRNRRASARPVPSFSRECDLIARPDATGYSPGQQPKRKSDPASSRLRS
jgi:hypothetical protein